MGGNRIPSLSRTMRDSGVVIIHIHGDLDTHGTREINPAFSVAFSDRTQHVIIDLTGVEFMGSAGLAMLATAAQVARRGGGSVSLSGAHGIVTDVIQQSGFSDMLSTYPTLEDAIYSIESGLEAE